MGNNGKILRIAPVVIPATKGVSWTTFCHDNTVLNIKINQCIWSQKPQVDCTCMEIIIKDGTLVFDAWSLMKMQQY